MELRPGPIAFPSRVVNEKQHAVVGVCAKKMPPGINNIHQQDIMNWIKRVFRSSRIYIRNFNWGHDDANPGMGIRRLGFIAL